MTAIVRLKSRNARCRRARSTGEQAAFAAGAFTRAALSFAIAEGKPAATAIEADATRKTKPIPDPSEIPAVPHENRISIDASKGEKHRLLT